MDLASLVRGSVSVAALGTIVACGGGDGGGGAGGAGGITVTGRIVSARSLGVPGVPVWIVGAGQTNTDANGEFTIAGVPVPYTLVVVHEPSFTSTVYVGLRRADPWVWFQLGSPSSFGAALSGNVTGGTGFPEPVTHDTRISFDLGHGSGLTTFADSTTGAYTSSGILQWDGPPATPLWVTFAQYAKDGAGLPTTFTGAGVIDIAAFADGASLTMDVALSPVSTTTLSGTYTLPAGFSLDRTNLSLERAPLAGLSLPDDTVDDGAFALNGPVWPGATFTVQVAASSVFGSQAFGLSRGHAAGASGILLSLQPPSDVIFPVDGAIGVDHDTWFSFSAFDQGIHLVLVSPTPPATGPTYIIATAGTEARIPDLGPIGIPLPGFTTYTWGVLALAPFSDLDAFAGPGAPISGLSYVNEGISTIHTFTTAP